MSLFSIVRIEELRPYIKLPNKPFRNTSHGFVLVQEGVILMQMDVLEYKLEKNWFIITPAGQVNNFLEISPEASGFMGTFHDHFFHNATLSAGVEMFSTLLNPESFPHFQPDGGLLKVITSICDRVMDLYNAPYSNSALIQNYWLTLLSELEPVFGSVSKSHTTRGVKIVLDFKNLLVQNIRNNPKPAYLADMLNVSINHLNKVLKKNTQLSTSEWISKRQIIEAQLMLRHSSFTIAEIAHNLGFEDPSYFSKFFFKHTKITPTSYRRD